MKYCTFTGCTNPAQTKQLCNGHYQQLWKSQELRPLQNRGEVPCTFSGCAKKAVSKGLCNGHYKQKRRGKPLSPLNPSKAVVKPLNTYKVEHTPCAIEACTRASTKATELCRNHNTKPYVWGLTKEQLLNMPTNCEVCGKYDESLHVDHDHSCCNRRGSCGKCVRGFICLGCNTALGMVQDNPETLQNLINYLQKHSQSRKS